MNSEVTPESLYALYPRHVGRGAAIKAITRALTKAKPERLLERVALYAACVREWPEDRKRFIPHPSTWFNQERWEDDPVEWRPQTNGQQQNPIVLKSALEEIRRQMRQHPLFAPHNWDSATTRQRLEWESLQRRENNLSILVANSGFSSR